MKVSIWTVVLLLSIKFSMAQNAVENELRKLDQLEAQATISGDTITLKKVWSPGFAVNNSADVVVNVP